MNFNLSVSDQGFDEKPKDYSKITFTQQNITLSQMVEVIRNGHLFCGIMQDSCFPINYKVSEHFIGTNVVSIDIDDCDCSMRDYMSTLSYTPSIAYETFSNLQEGKGYRFRFLYVFNDVLDAGEYRRLYYAICVSNNIGEFNDTHTGSPYQKIWGTSKDKDIIPVGILYSKSSFSKYMDNCPVPVPYKRSNRSNKQLEQDTPKFTDNVFEEEWNKSIDINLLTKMRHYQTYECTQIEWKDGELWRDLEDTLFFEIKRKWEMRLSFNGGTYKKVPVNRRLKNGEHRRKKIFLSLMRRRLIDPTVTLEHLCYAALYELYFFIENVDNTDYITRNQLMQIAKSVMNADMERYENKLQENRKFKVNKAEAIRQGMTSRQAVAKANSERISKRKEKEYAELAKKYDVTKSIRENEIILGLSHCKAYSLKKWIDNNCPVPVTYYIEKKKKNMSNKQLEQDTFE